MFKLGGGGFSTHWCRYIWSRVCSVSRCCTWKVPFMTQHRCPRCSFNKLLGSISIRDSEIPNLFSPSKPRGAIMRCSVNLCQWMVLHLCVLWIGMRISVVTESIKFCLQENSNIITVQCSTVDLSSLVYPVISAWPLTVQWFLLMHFKLHLAIKCRRQREMWHPLWGSLIGLSVVFASRCEGEVSVSKTRSASMGLGLYWMRFD